MVKFRAKVFSDMFGDMWTGAMIGASGGALSSQLLGRVHDGDYNSTTKNPNIKRALLITGGGAVLGAALGGIWNVIKSVDRNKNINRTVDNRLMQKVIEILETKGYKEDKDFTRDPRYADRLKTKVCIVVSKYSDDLRLLINTANDERLTRLRDEIIKSVPNGSVSNSSAGNRFNEITLSTITSANDSKIIADVAKNFIKNRYPVYLVEVG